MPPKSKKSQKGKKTGKDKKVKKKEKSCEPATGVENETPPAPERPVFTDEIEELNYEVLKAQQRVHPGEERWVEIMEVIGKGRGVIALRDIPAGKVVLRDVPLSAAIYGDETMPFPFQAGAKLTY